MSPVRFWDRSVDQAPAPATTSGVRPSWDPQDPPGDFDAVRDDLLVGDMYSDEWPEPVRHPSQHVLETFAASYPAARSGTAGEPTAVPAPEVDSSRASGAFSSDDEQPGRGHDRAA